MLKNIKAFFLLISIKSSTFAAEMLRYTQKYQKVADRFAREECDWLYGALYVGHYYRLPNEGERFHDWLVFTPAPLPNMLFTGVPPYIFMDDKEIFLYCDIHDIMHSQTMGNAKNIKKRR